MNQKSSVIELTIGKVVLENYAPVGLTALEQMPGMMAHLARHDFGDTEMPLYVYSFKNPDAVLDETGKDLIIRALAVSIFNTLKQDDFFGTGTIPYPDFPQSWAADNEDGVRPGWAMLTKEEQLQEHQNEWIATTGKNLAEGIYEDMEHQTRPDRKNMVAFDHGEAPGEMIAMLKFRSKRGTIPVRVYAEHKPKRVIPEHLKGFAEALAGAVGIQIAEGEIDMDSGCLCGKCAKRPSTKVEIELSSLGNQAVAVYEMPFEDTAAWFAQDVLKNLVTSAMGNELDRLMSFYGPIVFK